VIAGLVEGTLLHAYRFSRYKPPTEAHDVARLIVSAHHDVSEPVRSAGVVVGAQNRARDLANTPANDLPPAALAAYAERIAERHGLEAAVLDEQQIGELGMGAFAAVAQGSAQDARLIQLRYEGSSEQVPRLALVGKAVTFDSGGLSLKPAASMPEMKFDMSGGAAVIEAIAALAELRAPVRVLGVVGATENLPSASAVKPGDIVRALDGTTIEVNNTDAEGRLVLADCLCYARREGCERLIDIATLTGGIVTALGSTYAGLMSNEEAWAAELGSCAQSTGELVWRLPLHREYADMIAGRYAQLTNATERRAATPITAAELLHRFVADVPWAHLDIAGTAYDVGRASSATTGQPARGGRRLLDRSRVRALESRQMRRGNAPAGALRHDPGEREPPFGTPDHAGVVVGELHVRFGGFQQCGGARDTDRPEFPSRPEDGVARHVELARGKRPPGERGEGTVADVHGDAIWTDAEDFRGDLDQRRGLAAS